MHGDNVRTFDNSSVGHDLPKYFRVVNYDSKYEFKMKDGLWEINLWLHKCYKAIRKYVPEDSERNSDDDMRVLIEFHRRYLVNQDSVCIATCIEQIALNNVLSRQLKNQVYKLE